MSVDAAVSMQGRAPRGAARAAGVAVLLGLGLAGCGGCPDAYFAKDARFEVTVLGASRTHDTCLAAAAAPPPSFSAGDTFTLVGTGDQSFEAGMCDDGTLAPVDPPWFATDVLTACNPYGCHGTTASGCAVNAQISTDRDPSQTPAGGSPQGTFGVAWQSNCDPAFNCEERYDVSFSRLGP